MSVLRPSLVVRHPPPVNNCPNKGELVSERADIFDVRNLFNEVIKLSVSKDLTAKKRII